jgi:hypothetical protein
MDPHDRARRLLALATDASASPEEARTAAMAACRLIVKHKLLDHGPAPASDGAPRRRPAREQPANDDAATRRRARREPERPSYRADTRGTCAFCRKPFGPDDDVMTDVDGSVDHWHCAKRRAAGGAPSPR